MGYAIDILDDTSISGFAIFFLHTPGEFLPRVSVDLNGWYAYAVTKRIWDLAATFTNGSAFGLAGSFEDAFGVDDNAAVVFSKRERRNSEFLTDANDQNEASWSTFTSVADADFWRAGSPASQFVIFGNGGAVVDRSLPTTIPELQGPALLMTVLLGPATLRRRKPSRP